MSIPELQLFRCKLCGELFPDREMSEEHYPAKSVGNEDIIKLDIVKMMDSLMSADFRQQVSSRVEQGENIKDILENAFDTDFSESLYPKGRTSRTLCRNCNTHLGKYDKAYLKFFENDGNPKIIKGYTIKTKIQIIKAVFGKFLSVPEAANEKFDFIDFLRDDNCTEYHGKWHLYFIKRNYTTDLMGYADIGTGKEEFDEGVVYEFSDDKFVFNLLNFEKHSCFDMTNIFDITKKNFSIVEGVTDPSGGYHGQLLLDRLFSDMTDDSSNSEIKI